MSAVRWNIAVSQNTDQAVRLFLAEQGKSRKGALSHFIEEAVRIHILELSAEKAKTANKNMNEDELTMAIEEAVQWAREQ